MATHFSFDDSLIGYRETVTVDTTPLLFPMFVFPKGSFFVKETFIIKANGKIARPGIDYLVLSCNEKINYNDASSSINTKIKQSYVRNAVLWIGTNQVLKCVVNYCGGEETTKAAEYQNYLNTQYTRALAKGTYARFINPYQAWAGFVNGEGVQIQSGRDINNNDFDVASDRTQIVDGGLGGLGSNRLQTSIMALADTTTNKIDPLLMQAYHDTIRHYGYIVNGKIAELTQLNQELIVKGDQGRVGYGQFVFTDEPYNPSPEHIYAEHKNIILRASKTGAQSHANDPIATNRIGVGYFGLAAMGNDIELKRTRLFQRKDPADVSIAFKSKVSFSKDNYTKDDVSAGAIIYTVYCTFDAPFITGNAKTYTLYVVSTNLKRVIYQQDVTTYAKGTSGGVMPGKKVAYPSDKQKLGTDILFAYVLDENMDGNFEKVGRCHIVVANRTYNYMIAYNTRGNIFGENAPDQTGQITDSSSSLIVKLTRDFADFAETAYLNLATLDDGIPVSVNATVNDLAKNYVLPYKVTWAAGQYELIVNLNFVGDLFNQDKMLLLQLLSTNTGDISANELASVVIGYKNIGVNNRAYIQVVTTDDLNRRDISYTQGSQYYILARFAASSQFNTTTMRLKTTLQANCTGTVVAGEPQAIDESTYLIPIAFFNFANNLYPTEWVGVGIEINNTALTLTSNRVNIFVDPQGVKDVSQRINFTVGTAVPTENANGTVDCKVTIKVSSAAAMPSGLVFRVELLSASNSSVKVLNPNVAYAPAGLPVMLNFRNADSNGVDATLRLSYYLNGAPTFSDVVVSGMGRGTSGNLILRAQDGSNVLMGKVTTPHQIYMLEQFGSDITSVSVKATIDYASAGLKEGDIVFSGSAAVTTANVVNIFKSSVNLSNGTATLISNTGWFSITSYVQPASSTSVGIAYLPVRLEINRTNTAGQLATEIAKVGLYFADDRFISVTSRNALDGSDFYSLGDTINITVEVNDPAFSNLVFALDPTQSLGTFELVSIVRNDAAGIYNLRYKVLTEVIREVSGSTNNTRVIRPAIKYTDPSNRIPSATVATTDEDYMYKSVI